MNNLTIADIMGAKTRIRRYINDTPLYRAEKLEELFDGAEIWLKLENLQRTGSFKIRGVANKMLSLTSEELKYGVTAASSGNHAQAVSFMAAILGTKATIVMPENAPKSKITGAMGYGAEVILHGYTGEDRDTKCAELVREHGFNLVHSHTDPLVIAGHGTVAVDAWQQMNGVMDEIVLPCGAGSLTGGAALAIKQLAPSITVTAVEPAEVPRFTESLKRHKPVTVEMGQTIADGLRVSKAEEINFGLIQDNVNTLHTIDEESIRQAVKEMALRAHITAEPSACVGIAAALAGKLDTSRGRRLCFVISGGNIDAVLYAQLLSE
jgi:threonine dehydratase